MIVGMNSVLHVTQLSATSRNSTRDCNNSSRLRLTPLAPDAIDAKLEALKSGIAEVRGSKNASNASRPPITPAGVRWPIARKERKTGASAWAREIMRNRQVRKDELKHATEEHLAFLQQLAADFVTRRGLRKFAIEAFCPYIPVLGKKLLGDDSEKSYPQLTTILRDTRTLLLEKFDEIGEMLKATNGLKLTKFFRFVPRWLRMLELPFLRF